MVFSNRRSSYIIVTGRWMTEESQMLLEDKNGEGGNHIYGELS
jgi:hypothetical protein